MKVIIDLENMSFQAFHGCYELEKVVGNRFLIDLSVEAEVGGAPDDDDLSGSVNYLTVYEVVREQMGIPSDTLENVAKRIADSIRARFPQVTGVRAKVSKLAPPLGGKIEKVSVTVTV